MKREKEHLSEKRVCNTKNRSNDHDRYDIKGNV